MKLELTTDQVTILEELVRSACPDEQPRPDTRGDRLYKLHDLLEHVLGYDYQIDEEQVATQPVPDIRAKPTVLPPGNYEATIVVDENNNTYAVLQDGTRYFMGKVPGTSS